MTTANEEIGKLYREIFRASDPTNPTGKNYDDLTINDLQKFPASMLGTMRNIIALSDQALPANLPRAMMNGTDVARDIAEISRALSREMARRETQGIAVYEGERPPVTFFQERLLSKTLVDAGADVNSLRPNARVVETGTPRGPVEMTSTAQQTVDFTTRLSAVDAIISEAASGAARNPDASSLRLRIKPEILAAVAPGVTFAEPPVIVYNNEDGYNLGYDSVVRSATVSGGIVEITVDPSRLSMSNEELTALVVRVMATGNSPDAVRDAIIAGRRDALHDRQTGFNSSDEALPFSSASPIRRRGAVNDNNLKEPARQAG